MTYGDCYFSGLIAGGLEARLGLSKWPSYYPLKMTKSLKKERLFEEMRVYRITK